MFHRVLSNGNLRKTNCFFSLTPERHTKRLIWLKFLQLEADSYREHWDPGRNGLESSRTETNEVKIYTKKESCLYIKHKFRSYMKYSHLLRIWILDRYSPMNSWLLSCRWKCPSAGASCVATGSSSSRSDASFTFRSARTRCHRLSFSGTLDSTRTSSGPLPTSKEKTTWVEAWQRRMDSMWGKG